jgi:hypothetical protein
MRGSLLLLLLLLLPALARAQVPPPASTNHTAVADSRAQAAAAAAAVAEDEALLAAAEERLAADEAAFAAADAAAESEEAPVDDDAVHRPCEELLSMEDSSGDLCLTPDETARVCDTLRGLALVEFVEQLQGSMDAMEADAWVCVGLRYAEYGPAALVVLLLVLCCGYPALVFLVAAWCCIRPRAERGYRPGREAWKACAMVLVFVFYGLGVLGNLVFPVLALLYCWVQGPCCMVLPCAWRRACCPVRPSDRQLPAARAEPRQDLPTHWN